MSIERTVAGMIFLAASAGLASAQSVTEPTNPNPGYSAETPYMGTGTRALRGSDDEPIQVPGNTENPGSPGVGIPETPGPGPNTQRGEQTVPDQQTPSPH